MPKNTVCYLTGDAGGTCIEWFNDTDYDVPMIARWYGTRTACEARMKEPPPELYPWRSNEHQTDAATATGMYDR